mmetsp:Transcript_11637/g.17204  ORF Transcript_11637/g.17204 Transcript_11637/m.17204 type:complete len:217 (-) Transcript_11637:499-1149(-)
MDDPVVMGMERRPSILYLINTSLRKVSKMYAVRPHIRYGPPVKTCLLYSPLTQFFLLSRLLMGTLKQLETSSGLGFSFFRERSSMNPTTGVTATPTMLSTSPQSHRSTPKISTVVSGMPISSRTSLKQVSTTLSSCSSTCPPGKHTSFLWEVTLSLLLLKRMLGTPSTLHRVSSTAARRDALRLICLGMRCRYLRIMCRCLAWKPSDRFMSLFLVR